MDLESSSPKLPLTYEEKVHLRGSRTKLKDIERAYPTELANVLGSTLERAQLLCPCIISNQSNYWSEGWTAGAGLSVLFLANDFLAALKGQGLKKLDATVLA